MSAKNSTAAKNSTQVKSNKLSKLLTSTTLAAAGLIALSAPANADNWTDHQILDGSTTVDVSIPNTTNITQNTFFVKAQGSGDINSGWTVNVAQPSSDAKYVLYDVKGDATKLFGTLNANGEIYIFNEQGTIFGESSIVNVGSIITSTGHIADADIMAGKLVFKGVNTGGSIVLNGSVTVAEAGLAAFVAPQVTNNGLITAKLGKVAMAAGDTVTLDLYGDNLVEIAVDDKVADGLIKNSGVINAEGGTVVMAAQTAKAAVDDVINMGGVVNASSASVVGGKIVLSGGKQGKVTVSGKLNGDGATGGGKIDVRGQDIEVTQSALLSADATGTGNGGTNIVFADNLAIINGRMTARGGLLGGNGGFIETSGTELAVTDLASIDASAINGLSGLWLLDPRSIVIADSAGTTTNVDGRDYHLVSSTTLGSTLSNGTSVTVETGVTSSATTLAGGLFTPDDNAGDIRVRSNITHNGGAGKDSTLKLIAQGDISIENLADIRATGNSKLSLDFTAKGDDFFLISNEGNIVVNAGSQIDTKGGSALFTAAHNVSLEEYFVTNGGDANFVVQNEFRITNDDTLNTVGGNVSIIADQLNLGTGAGDRINAGNGSITIARDSNGQISLGNATGGLEISNAELDKMKTAHLVIGQQGIDSHDNNILLDGADLTGSSNSIGKVTLNTKRDDGFLFGTDENVVFRGLNTSGVLVVNADDDILFDKTGGSNASLGANGNVALNANTNNMSDGDLRLEDDSLIDMNGHNLTTTALNTRIEGDAVIRGESGDITLFNTKTFQGNTNSVKNSGDGTITLYQNVGGSIQNAVNAIDNSGTGQNTVNVGPGIFDETVQMVGQNNLWIKGAGQGVTIIKPTALGSAPALSNGTPWAGQTYTPVFLAKDANNVDVTGLTVDGTNVDSGTTAGLAYYNASGDVENVTILNGGAFGLYAVADSTKGHTARTVNATNVTSSGNSWAALAVIGNVLTANVTGGVYNGNGGSEAIDLSNGSKGTIANATVTTGSTGENAGIVFHGGHDWTITGGSITGSNAASTGIVDLGTVYGVPAAANVAINGVNISNVNTGVSANGGSNWDINGGAYTGAAGATGTGVKFANLTGSNSTIKNLTVSGFNEGIVVDASAGTQVTGNLIKNIVSHAVSVINSASVQVLNNVIGYTTLAANSEAGSSNIGGDGIKVNNGGSVVIKGNKIAQTNGAGAIEVINTNTATIGGAGADGNRIRNSNGGDGVRMESDSNVTVENNNIDGTNRVGIWGGWVNTATIKNNIVQNDHLGGYGSIHADFGSNWSVSGNDIDHGDYGIRLNTVGGTNTINGANKIDNVTADGIYVVNTSGLTIESNQIGANGGNVGHDGISVIDSAAAQIKNNVIKNFANTGIFVDPSPFTAITGNNLTGGVNGIYVLSSDDVTVGGFGVGESNTVTGSTNGIRVDNSANAQVLKNTVTNTANGISFNGVWSSNPAVKLSKITGNTVTNSANNGIQVWNSNDILVGDAGATNVNTITNTGWDGVNVQGGDNVTVKNNTITTVTGASGVAVLNSTDAVVTGNRIKDTDRLGVYAGNADNILVSSNEIENAGLEGAGNYLSGVHVEASDGVTITGNKIKNAKGDGINSGESINYGAGDNTGVIKINNNEITNVGRHGIIGTANIDEVNGNKINRTGAVNANGGEGIFVSRSGGVDINSNNIGNLTVLGNSSVAQNIKGDGILVVDSDGTNGNKTNIKGNTIKNTKSMFSDNGSGIQVLNSDYVQVGGAGGDRNTISNTGWDGVRVQGGDHVVVQNNDIDNVSRTGIYFGGLSNSTIKDNDIDGASTHYGIHISGGNNLLIENNDIDSVKLDGIFAQGVTSPLTIRYNEIGENGGSNNIKGNGIYVSGSDNAVIHDNDVTQTVLHGIKVNPSDFVDISWNDIWNVDGDGINVNGGTGVDIWENDIENAGGDGIDVSNNSNAEISSNDIYNVSQNGVRVAGSYNADVRYNDIDEVDADGINVSGSDYADIYNNDINLHVGGANAQGDGIDVSNSGHVDIYNNDIDDVNDVGVELTNTDDVSVYNNVITDANTGIRLNDSGTEGAIIDNNTIRNVEYGVWARDISDLIITDNDIDGRYQTSGDGEIGIYVEGSYNAQVGGWYDGNNVEDFETGIRIVDSSSADVEYNDVSEFDEYGIRVSGGTYVDVKNNDVYDGDGTGIRVYGSDDVEITGNDVDDVDGNGIELDNSDDALISWNDVSDADDDGINVRNSNHVDIVHNDIWDINHDGINVSGGDDVHISWNHVTDVSNDGIYVGGMSDWNYFGEGDELSPNVVISHNVVDWTGGDGIEVNDVYYSRITHNAVGLDGYASEDNDYDYEDGVSIGQNGILVSTETSEDPTVIDGNLVANTGWNGIAVYGVEDVTITNNTVWNTNDNGIVVEDAEWVDVSGNYVGVARPLFGPFSIGGGFIGDDGIRVGNYWYDNYGSVSITNNHVANTGDDGIDVYGVSEARILGNNVNMTGDDGIVASNIGNSYYGPSIFALEGDESEESEEGPYYNLIIADNTVTDAGQRNQEEDDCGDCGPYEFAQIFEGDNENYGGDGIDVSGTSSALIENNEVDNAYDDGIVVSGFGDEKMGKRGFFIYEDGPFEYGPGTSVVIRDNDVTNSGSDGIEVSNIDDATVDVNRILNSGVNGFHAGGFHNGTVVLTGNTFTDNPVGALFESGLIDLTGEANIFNGGEIGLRFDPKNEEIFAGYEEGGISMMPVPDGEGGFFYMPIPMPGAPIFETVTADLNLAGDTIGTTIFNGQSNYYVELLDGALFAPGTPTILNGLNATYDGFRPSTVGGILTQAQYNAIEAKIYHYNDLASLGLFFFGVVPGINDKDIYRAFGNFRPGNGPLSITITGLPNVPGFSGNLANFLNGIAPAAGGNTPPKPKKFANLVEQLANLEPAAGGNGGNNQQPANNNAPSTSNSTCWGDAMAAASGGTIVSMNYGEGATAALSDAASCQSGI